MTKTLKYRGNETESGQLKYTEEDLPQCHFAHNKFHSKKIVSILNFQGERTAFNKLRAGEADLLF